MAPGPPWNRVSPVNTQPSSAAWKQTAPGAWPGVWTTRSVVPATSTASPSARSTSQSSSEWVSSHSGRSSGCRRIGAAHPLAQRRGDAHVVVVGVRAEDRLDAPVADHREDAVDVVRGVDDHALLVVADDPDVVVDLEGLAVEA